MLRLLSTLARLARAKEEGFEALLALEMGCF